MYFFPLSIILNSRIEVMLSYQILPKIKVNIIKLLLIIENVIVIISILEEKSVIFLINFHSFELYNVSSMAGNNKVKYFRT